MWIWRCLNISMGIKNVADVEPSWTGWTHGGSTSWSYGLLSDLGVHSSSPMAWARGCFARPSIQRLNYDSEIPRVWLKALKYTEVTKDLRISEVSAYQQDLERMWGHWDRASIVEPQDDQTIAFHGFANDSQTYIYIYISLSISISISFYIYPLFF